MSSDDLQSLIDRSAQITAVTMLLSIVVGKSDRRRAILDLYRRRIQMCAQHIREEGHDFSPALAEAVEAQAGELILSVENTDPSSGL